MNAKRAANVNAKKKGDRSFITLLAVVGVIGLAIIGYVVLKPKPAARLVDANLPLPEAKGYVVGSDSAPVEILEFGDFECPSCGQFATITEPDILNRLVASGAARFRYLDFPLQQHTGTMFAHNAAACANAQGKFWEMQSRIYANQFEWSELARGRDMNPPKIFKRYAKELGLDTQAFNNCFESRQFEPQIKANQQEGVRRIDRIAAGGEHFRAGRRGERMVGDDHAAPAGGGVFLTFECCAGADAPVGGVHNGWVLRRGCLGASRGPPPLGSPPALGRGVPRPSREASRRKRRGGENKRVNTQT